MSQNEEINTINALQSMHISLQNETHTHLSQNADSGYMGIMILHEFSRCDSSNSLCVCFCIHIGYRGIMIL